MTPEPTTLLPHRVYGDWEWNHTTNRPDNIYPARIISRWSGGVEFLTDRATAEAIVAAQQRIRAGLTNPEDVDALEWDGDTIVYTGVDSRTYRYSPDDEGLYHCGFGWTWSEWIDDDDADHTHDAESPANSAGYTRATNARRTDVRGPGGTGWVIHLFPIGVGFNAFVGADEYIGHFDTADASVEAIIQHLQSSRP